MQTFRTVARAVELILASALFLSFLVTTGYREQRG